MARAALLAACLVVLTAGTAAAQDRRPATVQGDSSRVVAAVLAALDRHDISRATQFFTDDATIMTTVTVTGREGVGQWLGSRFSPDVLLEVTPYADNGARVTWTSRMTHGYPRFMPRFELTWDEAVVINGRIRFWSTRPLTETNSVPPQFVRAETLDPEHMLTPDEIEAASANNAGVLGAAAVGLAVAFVAGVALGVFERATQREQWHGGQRLATLHARISAYNAARAGRRG